MPQIQVLPAAPGFGSQLGAALGGGLSQGISGALSSMLEGKKNRRALEGLSPLFKEAGIELTPEDKETFLSSGLKPETLVPFISQFAKQKKQESISDTDYTDILDQMQNMLKEGEAGLGATVKSYLGPLGANARESTARFQSLGTSLLGLAQKVALKQGIRNQREFDTFLKRTIPNATDTVETAMGKVNALRSYIKTGKLAGKPSEKETIKKVETGSTLDKETAQQILEKAGNDIEKARKLAKQLGYEF